LITIKQAPNNKRGIITELIIPMPMYRLPFLNEIIMPKIARIKRRIKDIGGKLLAENINAAIIAIKIKEIDKTIYTPKKPMQKSPTLLAVSV